MDISRRYAGMTSIPEELPSKAHLRRCTLHVCTSCRAPGTPREPPESRPGYILYQELCATFNDSPLRSRVDVRPAECLSVCPRPCGIALWSAGAWTYLFGDQNPGETTRGIVACVSLYVEARDPKSLRASVLGRVPPSPGER